MTRTWVVDFTPMVQLLICGSVGLLAGAAFICAYAPSRRVALSLLDVLREWKNSRKVSL